MAAGLTLTVWLPVVAATMSVTMTVRLPAVFSVTAPVNGCVPLSAGTKV